MSKLIDRYPNFKTAFDEFSYGSNIKLVLSWDTKVEYSMPYVLFNDRVATIKIFLFNTSDIIQLTFQTIQDDQVKATSRSKAYIEDLDKDIWLDVMKEVMMNLYHSEGHQKVIELHTEKKLLNPKSNNNGCAGLLMSILFSLISLIFIFY